MNLTELLPVTVLLGLGLLWLLVNLKVRASSPMKTVSYLLMWLFLFAGTALALWLVWRAAR